MSDESPLLRGGKASFIVSSAGLNRGSVYRFENILPPCPHVQRCNLH